MRFTSKVLSGFWLLFLFFGTLSAHAVMRSAQGQGEALILPYFNTLQGNTTLLTLAIPESPAKAIKVHFRNTSGEIVFSFNLYLEGRGSWVAALSSVDGSTTLSVPDGSCVLPNLAIADLGELEKVRSGFVEIIEMGDTNTPEVPSEEIREMAQNQDCTGLETMWSTGVWAEDPTAGLAEPSGGIHASASIINVERGTQYGFNAIALQDFSDIVQHTMPTNALPDLTSAHTMDTDSGETISTVCDEKDCQSYVWGEPIDAVASALAAFSMQGDFSTAEGVGTKTEAILTFPLRYQFEKMGRPGFAENLVRLNLFDRDGKGEINSHPCLPLIETPPCGTAYSATVSESVFSVVFGLDAGDEGKSINSPIMAEASTAFFPTVAFPFEPESGSFALYFHHYMTDDISLVTANDSIFLGRPVIAVLFTEVRNRYLIDGDTGEKVRANYGTSSEPVRDMRYQE